MKKTLITLGIVAAAALPAAAFAHPVVEFGVGFGGPVYAPAPVYAPPAVVYDEPGYVYGPTVVYPGYYGYPRYHGFYGPHFYRHYGYRY